MGKTRIEKYNILAVLIAFIHWVITFFSDHLVFVCLEGNGVLSDFLSLKADSRMHFVICKIVLLIILIFIWTYLISSFRSIACLGIKKWILGHFEENKENAGIGVLRYALFYFVPIIAVLIFKLPQGFLSNDESLIFQEAASLNTYTWFYYLTTYYYVITMMLIPCWLGPVFTKVVLQLFVCGYCVFRLHAYLKSKKAYFIYLPFFLPPVLAYTTSAHRIPIYYLLYLLLLFTLFMDKLENNRAGKLKLLMLIICGTLITQWRTEGIYMLILLPLLLFIAYPYLVLTDEQKINYKSVLSVLAISFAIQYLFTVPQNGFVANRLSDQADNRMGPFWAYTITNMYRNGLDLEKNSSDMEKIWRYLDKDTLWAINDDLKDINYEDVLILYYEGYTGKIEGASPEDYNSYVEGCKNVFINNPDVLLRTRIGAFKYSAMPYHIAYTEGGIKGLAKFLISIIKTCAYNLYIPCIFLIAFWIFSVVKKKPLIFLASSGLICHWFIVFVLAPASYFKYYFPIYAGAYLSLAVFIILMSERRDNNVRVDSDKQA